MSQTSKPFFSKDIVEKIVSVVNYELAAEGMTANEDAIRTYIQAPKTTYENAILSGVAEGVYLATIKKDEFAYKIRPVTDEEVKELHQAATARAEAAQKQGEYKTFVATSVAKKSFEDARKKNHLERARAFEQSKHVPPIEKLREAATMERAARLSHALNWCVKSPKLGTTAEKVQDDKVVTESV